MSVARFLIALVLSFAWCWAAQAQPFERYVSLSGQRDTSEPEYVQHGDPELSGTATLTFDFETRKMDFDIQLEGNRYAVTQAHMYRFSPGDSEFCWGGRWSDHDFLSDTGFVILGRQVRNIREVPGNWYLMIHTEGGHFAVDESGDLVEYMGDVSQETQASGLVETGERYNNRTGRKLTDFRLRDDNPHFADDNAYYSLGHFERDAAHPFSDALGNDWIEPDDFGGYQPSPHGLSMGLTQNDVDTKTYLFYLYDDQGMDWDYGGPEGAAGGFLSATPVPEPSREIAVTVMLLTLIGLQLSVPGSSRRPKRVRETSAPLMKLQKARK